ncbi:D-alanine--D-alanine ligase [Hippea sp. KM1]|uniref:D-alanine--D-alanine ligase n=1 Tax=Hippea sp. KM1 TaxID=944481 RepID=UPI0004A7E940|nr:D-alanine--D-alanine ligase [Hippea sp. KM1]
MKVAVICGGNSSEREVSIITGNAVYNGLLKNFEAECIVCDTAKDCINKVLKSNASVVFVALHGGFGENGQIQATFESLGIKYTGCSFSESNIAMNKFATKSILKSMNIPTSPFKLVRSLEELQQVDFYPICLKPNAEGSSVDVNFADTREQATTIAEKLLNKYGEILVEKKLNGKELTVGILFGKPLEVIEIRPKKGFYDYKNKYTQGATDYIVPAPLPENITNLTKQIAKRAFYAIGCKGYARVDMILEGNVPYVLEINTIPGMTPTSLLPKAAQASGITFEELVKLIVEGAC